MAPPRVSEPPRYCRHSLRLIAVMLVVASAACALSARRTSPTSMQSATTANPPSPHDGTKPAGPGDAVTQPAEAQPAEARPAEGSTAAASTTAESAPPPNGNDTSTTAPTCQCMDAKPPLKAKPKPSRPAPRQDAPEPQKPGGSAVPPPAEVAVDADVKLLNGKVESVLGRKVKGLNGEDFGRVVDVLADAAGRVRVAIIDFGGFLGVGNRRIAVDWSLVRVDPEHQDAPLILRLTTEKLQSAPEYKDNARPPVLMVP